MRFKQYLKEMPHFINGMKLKCPKGDIIDGNNSDYQYDYGGEFIKDKSIVKELMPLGIGSFIKPTGKLPIYCKKHKIMFMYDFDNKEVSSSTSDDKKLMNIIKSAMIDRMNRDNEPVPSIKIT